MPDLPTDADVLSAVEQAGWLLEQHAVRVLQRADMHPRPSWAFEDPIDPATCRMRCCAYCFRMGQRAGADWCHQDRCRQGAPSGSMPRLGCDVSGNISRH